MKEKKRGAFSLKSRAFPRFHEDPAGSFRDVGLDPDAGCERFPVSSPDERDASTAGIAATLERRA